jgi:hypothetical protein
MWGNHRRASTYYSCQPWHQRAKDIPANHPSHVYLNAAGVDEALRAFLATALFGPGRQDCWRRCLEDATAPDRVAPASVRRDEVEAEIAELERRLDRQVCNLESDEVTPLLRRRVAARIAELEEAIAERQTRLAALDAETVAGPVSYAAVASLLDRLPILGHRLADAPDAELRTLYEALQLKLTYHPAEQQGDDSAQVRAEDCFVPPGGAGPVLRKVARLEARLRLV